MAYKSNNPALNKNTFKKSPVVSGANAMTLSGVAVKSLLLLLAVVSAGYFGWNLAASLNPAVSTYLLAAVIGGFVVALITIFKQSWSPVTAPMYAVLEGVALGIISQIYEAQYGGIVGQALLLTGAIFVAMLLLYLLRIIKPTENFKLAVAAATGGIALFYFAAFILGLFGISAPLIHSNSWWGIAFTAAVVVVAAFNLVVDFDFVEQGVEHRAPKYMEWYAGFGLLVTLVWLYLELLRLLSKLRSR